jgi:hypothetical protein
MKHAGNLERAAFGVVRVVKDVTFLVLVENNRNVDKERF